MATALRSFGIASRSSTLVAAEENSTGRGRVPEQYCFETCLPEMVIRCPSPRNPALFHHQERQAVGEVPVLVASGLVKTRGSGDHVNGEGHNLDLRILVTSPVSLPLLHGVSWNLPMHSSITTK
jgi:hypothetical protein